MNAPEKVKLKAKDFATDQEVRWCPGCGDYAILKTMQKTLAELGADADNTAFVSGIGCAARFPYYMATYGFHTIHGRAAAVATGLRMANPDLDIWVVGGDGDSLSIGGNHLLHLLRRNVDVQYLLFNNEIYGLTKGQYSPTSRPGTRSPSSPAGSVDGPVHAVSFALGAGANFVARGVDVGQAVLADVLTRAHGFRGTSFVEILQNCIVYNDGIFDSLTDKKTVADSTVHARHGEPLVFGKDSDRGVRVVPGRFAIECVTLGVDGITEADILIHDETDPVLAGLLGALGGPGREHEPTAVGVLYCNEVQTFEARRSAGKPASSAKDDLSDLQSLFETGNTWQVQ